MTFNVFKQTALDCINAEKARLFQDALTIANSFWEAQEVSKKSDNRKELTFIGTRVRLIRTSLVCEWYRTRTGINAKTGKRYVFSRYIPMTKKHHYSMTQFSHEPAWAQQMILLCEEQYRIIRERYEVLNKMERMLKKY